MARGRRSYVCSWLGSGWWGRVKQLSRVKQLGLRFAEEVILNRELLTLLGQHQISVVIRSGPPCNSKLVKLSRSRLLCKGVAIRFRRTLGSPKKLSSIGGFLRFSARIISFSSSSREKSGSCNCQSRRFGLKWTLQSKVDGLVHSRPKWTI